MFASSFSHARAFITSHHGILKWSSSKYCKYCWVISRLICHPVSEVRPKNRFMVLFRFTFPYLKHQNERYRKQSSYEYNLARVSVSPWNWYMYGIEFAKLMFFSFHRIKFMDIFPRNQNHIRVFFLTYRSILPNHIVEYWNEVLTKIMNIAG